MTLNSDYFTYRVTWSVDDEEFVGLCAEFPSLSWLDESPETALQGIKALVKEVVADMQKTGEQIPAAISFFPEGRHKDHQGRKHF